MTVAATNAGGTASIDVTIQEENLDEPGVVSVSPGSQRCSVQQATSLSDPYSDATRVPWSWEKSEDGTTWTAIDGAPEASDTPLKDDIARHLRITAAYTDPAEPATGQCGNPRHPSPRGRWNQRPWVGLATCWSSPKVRHADQSG